MKDGTAGFIVGLLLGFVGTAVLASLTREPALAARERCRAHAEYAKTALDSLAVVRRFPECATIYYVPKEAP